MMKKLTAVILVILSMAGISFGESATATLAEMYSEAELLMAQGDYSSAASKFESLGTYSDSSQMAMYAKAVMAAEELDLYDMAITAFEGLGDFKDSKQMAVYYKARQYQYAAENSLQDGIDKAGLGTLEAASINYEIAWSTYKDLALFKDSMIRMSYCNKQYEAIQAEIAVRRADDVEATYQSAIALEEERKYTEALEIFNTLGDYKDSAEHVKTIKEQLVEIAYQEALALEADEKYSEAAEAFISLADYKDSVEHLSNCYIEIGKTMRLNRMWRHYLTSEGKDGTVDTYEDYTYDENGHLKSIKITRKEKGRRDQVNVMNFTVDSNGKIIESTEKTENINHKNTYDEYENIIKEVLTYNDNIGTVKKGEVRTVVTEYKYDEHGNITYKRTTIPEHPENTNYPQTYTDENTYDEYDRIIKKVRTSQKTKKSFTTVYTYNEYGLLGETRFEPDDKSGSWSTTVETYQYEVVK